MLFRAILIWFGLMVLAIANGTLRTFAIVPYTGERVGHWISTVLLAALILLATWLGWPWLAPRNATEAWRIGIGWTLLTLAFGFLAGHYLFKKPWSVLLADYDLSNGRIWIVVLISTLLAPWLVALMRGYKLG